MDVFTQIRSFLDKYQTTGWLLLLMGIGLILQILLGLFLPLFGEEASFTKVLNYFLLPSSGEVFIHQPWSLITYGFFVGGSGNDVFFRLLYDCMLLWIFGRIHQQFLSNLRTKRIVILGIPIIAILSLIICAFLSIPQTPEDPSSIYMSGMRAIIVMLVVSSISLVPDYNIDLFLLGRVKIIWVGLVTSIIAVLMQSANIPMTIMIIVGAGLGYLHVYLLRNGTDITEVVWSYYQDKEPKPRMTVKYGDRKKAGKKSEKTQQPISSKNGKKLKKGEVSQEIVDKILDKISEKGYNSLSREEKEILFKASNQDDEKKE